MSDENKDVDWLEGDVEQRKAEQKILALETAKMYEVFVDTPRAKEILDLWEATIVNVTTPVESSIQKYAADNALRDFVQGIRRQIKMAQELRE